MTDSNRELANTLPVAILLFGYQPAETPTDLPETSQASVPEPATVLKRQHR